MKFMPAVVFGVFVVGAAAAFAVITGSTFRQAVPFRPVNTGVVRTTAIAPLELVALEDDRDGDRFIVRGIVRNPTGDPIDGLAAVVSVFGRDGALITSGRAAVAAPTLAAGTETPFVVTIPNADDVDRYHVSFSTAAGIVPHLDRRARVVMAQLP